MAGKNPFGGKKDATEEETEESSESEESEETEESSEESDDEETAKANPLAAWAAKKRDK